MRTSFTKNSQTSKLTQKDFILKVADHLMMSNHSSQKCAAVQSMPSCTRLLERYYPNRQENMKNCKMCKGRKRTTFCCHECCPSDPVPFCPVPCFRLFHTLEKIPTKPEGDHTVRFQPSSRCLPLELTYFYFRSAVYY